MKPLAVDLCCGFGGWASGLLSEGWDVVGFDIENHKYGEHQYPAQLVLQDIRTLNGIQFRRKVSLIVCSPPCQKYSYMAMPWSRSKALAKWYGDPEYPERLDELNELFNACIRIGREAQCPTIIENVRGAQKWVGRARWNYGSFYLWGDVPALMPTGRHVKQPGDSSWFYDNYESPMRRFSSKSPARKAASAMIAKIPFALARHIAAVYKPQNGRI